MAEGQVDTKGTEPAPPPPEPIVTQEDDLATEALAQLSAEEREGLGISAPAAAEPAPQAPAPADPAAPQGQEPAQQPEPGQEPAQEPAAAPAAEPGQEPAQPPAEGEGVEAQGQQEEVTIPLARLNQVLDGRRQDREELAHLRGLVEGLKSQPQTAQPQQPPQPTPQQQLAQIDRQVAALDQRFETGEDMTTGDYLKQSRTLEQHRTNLLLEIQRNALASQRPQQTQTPPPADDAYLEAQTDQLETQHPYLAELSEQDVDFLGQRVLNQAAAEGKPIDTKTAAGILRWRSEVAKLSDTLGPALTGKQIQPAGQQPNANVPVQTQAQGAGQTDMAAARAAKLDLQAQMPPDTAQIGSGADKTGLTGADLIAKAEKDPSSLEDIPEDQLGKFLQ